MPSAPLDRTAVRTAVAVLVGGITVILDSTIVSVALRDLATDLHVPISTVQWVSTGYLLALGVVIPVVGWLQSLIGGRRLWMWALGTFLLGSVLCSLAWNVQTLIAFRMLQGVGGGMMMPLMTTLIMQSTPAPDRARLMSMIALPSALGPIVGPIIGGLILSVADWRWLFWVNVPFGVVGLLLARRDLPAAGPGRRTSLDLVGLALLPPGLVAMLWGLSNASGSAGFDRLDVLGPIVLGAGLLAAFARWALRRPHRALVDLRVLRSRATWTSSLLLFVCGGTLYGAMFLLPLYWQELRGHDALHAGLLLVPQGIGSLISRRAATRMLPALGARPVVMLGFALFVAGAIPFALSGAETPWWILLSALFVLGLGLGMTLIPLMTTAYEGLAPEQIPDASTVTRIAQQIGGTFGTALLAAVLTSGATAAGSLAVGFDRAFWCSVAVACVAFCTAWLLPGRTTSVAPQPQKVSA